MKGLALKFLTAAALSLLLVSGCGKGTSPTSLSSLDDPSGSGPADAAIDATNRGMQTADSLGHGPCGAFGIPLLIPSGCPWNPSTSSFVCGPDVGDDGLTSTRSYQFLDANGVPQSAFDSSATASIHFLSHLGGTITRHGVTTVVDDNRDLTVSGLAGHETTRVWNGTGTSSRHDSSSAGAVGVHSTTVVEDVTIPAPFARDSWPLSGTITTHLVSTIGTDVLATITFNGTRNVPLTIGDTTITIDLARACHGGPGPIAGGDPPGRGGRGHRGRGRH